MPSPACTSEGVSTACWIQVHCANQYSPGVQTSALLTVYRKASVDSMFCLAQTYSANFRQRVSGRSDKHEMPVFKRSNAPGSRQPPDKQKRKTLVALRLVLKCSGRCNRDQGGYRL